MQSTTDSFFLNEFEVLFVEINLGYSKWLFVACYHIPSQNDDLFFSKLSNQIDFYLKTYDNFFIAGDFNCQETEPILSEFLNMHSAENIVKDETCFKSIENPCCIDLFLTNTSNLFFNTNTINAGLSDCHKMAVTVLRKTLQPAQPKVVSYRDYQNFDNELFKSSLQNALNEISRTDYIKFEEVFLEMLNRHAPVKQKTIRGNHAPCMTKGLRKAIMRRSELETKYHKHQDIQSLRQYKKQKKFCSKLYKKERKKYYSRLNIKDITDSKKLWKTVKPLISDKCQVWNKINLMENDLKVPDDYEIAETFKIFFENAVKNFNVSGDNDSLSPIFRLDNPVDIAVEKFKYHPSITLIKSNVNASNNFFFKEVNLSDIFKEISSLNSKEQGTKDEIPAKFLKTACLESSFYLTKVWNEEMLTENSFPQNLKLADVVLVFKKCDPTCAKNYQPISVLPAVSKVSERLMHDQITTYMDAHLSKHLCEYRKGFNSQTALLSLIEKWKSILAKKSFSGAVLMDLSKVFDAINHELLIAKLDAYGFSKKSLELILDYLSNCLQHVKINSTFSSWSEITQGVPQGYVLGPLLFNIYLNDLFFLLGNIDVCNSADDTAGNVCDMELKVVLDKLENCSELAIAWFKSNYMKLNEEKCKLLVCGYRFEQIWIKVGDNKTWEKSLVNLLGVTIDNELKFDKYVAEICAKAMLLKLSKFLCLDKRRTLLKSFIGAHFKYWPLIRMFCSRASNKKINRLHEKASRLVYDDYSSGFEMLLERDSSFTIHHQNIQSMLIEIYKSLNKASTENFFNSLFEFKFRQSQFPLQLKMPFCNSVYHSKNSIRYFGPQIWNSVPFEIRNAATLEDSSRKIKC